MDWNDLDSRYKNLLFPQFALGFSVREASGFSDVLEVVRNPYGISSFYFSSPVLFERRVWTSPDGENNKLNKTFLDFSTKLFKAVKKKKELSGVFSNVKPNMYTRQLGGFYYYGMLKSRPNTDTQKLELYFLNPKYVLSGGSSKNMNKFIYTFQYPRQVFFEEFGGERISSIDVFKLLNTTMLYDYEINEVIKLMFEVNKFQKDVEGDVVRTINYKIVPDLEFLTGKFGLRVAYRKGIRLRFRNQDVDL